MKKCNIFNKKRGEIKEDLAVIRKCLAYAKRYINYSFYGTHYRDEAQYEAAITRWYHTIEKGLAYTNFRSGFGAANLDALLSSMENYISDGYSEDAFFYKTALSTLHEYQKKNEEHGYVNDELNSRIAKLPGKANDAGGFIEARAYSEDAVKELNYSDFIHSRHSMRHFADTPLNRDSIKRAIELAQMTPSACNRQSWGTRVILDADIIKQVLSNQNGNEGFGHEIKGLMLIIADMRGFNKNRELYQAYIDSGMYCQSMLNALHYEHIATIPLSASLTRVQEKNIREILSLSDAELPIMFIGMGNYPEEMLTTKSERKAPNVRYYE